MSRSAALTAVILATLVLVSSKPTQASPPLLTVIDMAGERQDFYPVGAGHSTDMQMYYYVLGGELSVTKLPQLRGAILANITAGPDGPGQVVEVETVVCASRTAKPTFRILYDAKGRILSTGPVTDPGAVSIVTPLALGRAAEVLCSGVVPADALHDRTLADFRQPATPTQ